MIIRCEQEGLRIDVFLSEQVETLSRSGAGQLAEKGKILVGGKPVKKNYKTHAGDEISFALPEPEPVELLPENIPLDIRYEDEDVIVINTPKGLVVHPAPGHWSGTLVNALMYHCKDSLSGINGELRPGIVHRIDMETSGLLIVAVVILHNLLGYATGFAVGKALHLSSSKCRAISIEVGMQNSGLATSLAATHFAQYPLATIPGAVFSVWHNISGAILDNFFARTAEKNQ